MDEQRWHAVQQIFWQVRDLDAAAREHELRERCGNDTALLAEVRSLLAADHEPGMLDTGEPLLGPLRDVLRETVPKQVGPYTITGEIGRGGMGIVFRAHDPRLQRDVALKFLSSSLHPDPAARARFIAEARAASALDHPNICTIYDIGSTPDDRLFIAMAYYAHGTLAQRLADGPLPLHEAADIALQVADALDCAHEAGIVHRDVKPANIAFGERGEVKVLDFGVAVLGDDADAAALGVVGTPAYMAPEQVRGEAVDRRADVWALGLVVYEMLSGTRPFAGADRATVLHAIAHDEPPDLHTLRPDLPPAIARVVAHALKSVPAERISSAREFTEALRAAMATPATRRRALLYAAGFIAIVLGGVAALQLRPADNGATRAIAVLPFANLSDDQQNEHFADGVTEDILTQLSRVPGLHVRSRTSVMRYKGTSLNVREIGDALDVGYVLEGSVRRDGDDVRIAAQLIDARTDRHVWADTYDRRLTDLFLAQSEIARDIARALGARMTSQRAASTHAPADANTYEQFLLGRERFHTRTRESLEEAIALLRSALERDPDYALAHAFLANAYVRSTGPDYNRVGQREWLDSAAHHARRAIALAPRLPDGYGALGAAFNAMGRRDEAIQQHERALAADPNYSLAMFELARTYRQLFRYDEAVLWIERALAIDPARPDYRGYAATLYEALGMPDEGRRHALAGLRLNPADVTLHWEAVQLEMEAGDTAAAARHLRAYIALRPAEQDRMMAWFEILRGNNNAARPYVDRLAPMTTAWYDLYAYAAVYRAVGDIARGDSLVQRARELARIGTTSHAGAGPSADFLRAQAHAANGNHEQALQYLESWMNAGGLRSWNRVDREDVWGTLRHNAQFRDIVARTSARRDQLRARIRAHLATIRSG